MIELGCFGSTYVFKEAVSSTRMWLDHINLTYTSSNSTWSNGLFAYLITRDSITKSYILNTWKPFLWTLREHRTDLIEAHETFVFKQNADRSKHRYVLDGKLMFNLLMVETNEWHSPSLAYELEPVQNLREDEFWKNIDTWYPYLFIDDGVFLHTALDSDLTDTDMNMIAESDCEIIVDTLHKILIMFKSMHCSNSHMLLRRSLAFPELMERLYEDVLDFPYMHYVDYNESEWEQILSNMLVEAPDLVLRRFCDTIEWALKSGKRVPRSMLDPDSIHENINLPFNVVLEDALSETSTINRVDKYSIVYHESIMDICRKYGGYI